MLSQRFINDETANETTKILSELSAAQQRCAKLAAELSSKEQMVRAAAKAAGGGAAGADAGGGCLWPASGVYVGRISWPYMAGGPANGGGMSAARKGEVRAAFSVW